MKALEWRRRMSLTFFITHKRIKTKKQMALSYGEQKEGKLGYELNPKAYKRESYKEVKQQHNRKLRRIAKSLIKKDNYEQFPNYKKRRGWEY